MCTNIYTIKSAVEYHLNIFVLFGEVWPREIPERFLRAEEGIFPGEGLIPCRFLWVYQILALLRAISRGVSYAFFLSRRSGSEDGSGRKAAFRVPYSRRVPSFAPKMVREVPSSTIRGIEKVFQTHFSLANL